MAEKSKKTLRTHRWEPGILAAAEDYAAAQEVPPTEIAVLEAAAREFLQKRGFYPPKPKPAAERKAKKSGD